MKRGKGDVCRGDVCSGKCHSGVAARSCGTKMEADLTSVRRVSRRAGAWVVSTERGITRTAPGSGAAGSR